MKRFIVIALMFGSIGLFAQHTHHTSQDTAVIGKTTLEPKTTNGSVDFGGRVVRYDLYAKDTIVNFTGKNRHAIAINGQIPGPTLYFTEGDTAEIHLHNRLKNQNTGLHWHGVILPNNMDGVPYLTQMPVKPGEEYVYRFKVVQNGTYWYHSHEGLQEQIGMYGAMVFRKRNPGHENLAAEIPVLISEWADMKPMEIMRRLHANRTDWFAIKKGSVQSYSEALLAGHLGTKLGNEWKRMEAMDISDVYYDRFLINGSPSSSFSNLKAGDKVKLRVINGGSSSYFWLTYGGGKMMVVATDGNPVEPVMVDKLIVGVSETYDVIVTIPEDKRYEFRATAEDRSGFSSLWLGSGEQIPAPGLEKLMLFEGMKSMNQMMKMSGNMKPMNMEMGMQQMDMNEVMYPEIPEAARKQLMKHMAEMMMPAKTKMKMPPMKMDMTADSQDNAAKDLALSEDHSHHHPIENATLKYGMLKSPVITAFPKEVPIKELSFVLEGNMLHYLWTLNNKTVTEGDKILIKKGEVLRIKLYNNSMMRHPMHLHGHDFRILNGQGDYAPNKTVLDVMPMETDVLEFPANQEGDWFFHCHILYHMMGGMGNIFSYENSPKNPELPANSWSLFKKDNQMVYATGELAIESRSLHAEGSLSGSRYALQGELHAAYQRRGYDGEVRFGRYLGKFQWAMPYIGFQTRDHIEDPDRKTLLGQRAEQSKRNVFTVGMQYVLPFLITADAGIDQNGKIRVQLGREDIALTPRLRGNFMVNTDREYRFGGRYILNSWLSLSSHYDSNLGWSAGLTLSY